MSCQCWPIQVTLEPACLGYFLLQCPMYHHGLVSFVSAPSVCCCLLLQAFNKPIIVPTSPLAGWDELDFLENCTITVPYSTSEYGSNSSRQAASLSSSSNSSTLEAVSSTADGGAEASSGNQHSSITQSLDQDLLNEHITKAPCSGSEDLHSATAGSHSGFNSLEASEERPAAEQLLPSQLSVEESAGTETKITWCPLRCPAEVGKEVPAHLPGCLAGGL